MNYSTNIYGYNDEHYHKDEDGKPVERTPSTHPYSYDAHIVYGKTNKEVKIGYINGSVYDDRMMQSDYNKFNRLKEELLNKIPFENCKKETLEKFLENWNDNTIKVDLVRIMKGCNISNGFPYYVFEYHYDEVDVEIEVEVKNNVTV